MVGMCGDPHDPYSAACQECACYDGDGGCDYERELEELGIEVARD